MKLSFSSAELILIENIQSKYPSKEASIMPLLWFAQNKFGWLSPDVILLVSNILAISPSEVEGVATFYTMFYKKPMGKYHIQVCTNISCMLREGVKIYSYLSDKLGIKNMEITPDNKFSIEEVECMGACGGAPMIAINEDYYENITIDKIDGILNTLK